MANAAVSKAIAILKEQKYYDSVQALMGWDLWAGLSKEGQPYRNEVSSFFTLQSLGVLKSKETQEVVDKLRCLSDSDFSDIYEKAACNALIDRYDRAVQVPPELQLELRKHTAEAQKAWQESWRLDSFDYYKPYLKKLFDLKLKTANAINPNANPFDVLCDTVDKGIDTAEVGRIFGALKTGIGNILNTIRPEHETIDPSIIQIDCTKQQMRDVAAEINALTGYDYDKGRDSETVHGMCTGVGPKDSRIAISYRDLWSTIFTMLHEGGHGRYNHSSCDRAVECGVWGGVGGATHEGQARFYENIIGRSREFITLIYPIVAKHFPQLEKITPEQLYKSVNKVSPSLVRLGADELTYSLHPIIRFEIEQDFFNGKITTDDFQEVWNAKYKECFGLTPTTVKNGVLQDIHWASGHVGYFQSYTLGNLYGGQLLNTMMLQNPNFYGEIAAGNFSFVNQWLYKYVHQFGSYAYTPKELLINATGKPLSEVFFLDYLSDKYIKNWNI